ncbi:MAG: methyl-accepting chemotaxis protein [Thermacetogenium sp.]|nr:methyl-accepting chemotaxis protein [Thermacetogenium sp.]
MRLRLRWKLLVLLSGSLLVFSAVMGFYCVLTMYGKVTAASHEKLKSDLALGEAYLDLLYPGSWEIRDGKLYKGDTLMNGNNQAVDKIGELTGDTVTIFQGNTRVATNVFKDGERAIGTTVAPEVEKTVLDEGRTYIGKADVVGTLNHTAYQPIRDSKGQVIGIWYVGVPDTPYRAMAVDFALKLGGFALLGLVGMSLISWFLAGYICRPLHQLADVMNEAQNGDFTVRAAIRTRDEFEETGEKFNQMMELLGQLLTKVVELVKSVFVSTEQLSIGTGEAVKVTEQIAAAIEQVASGTDNQAKSIEETSNRLAGMITRVQKVNQCVTAVAAASERADRATEDGNRAITQTVEQMQAISSAVSISAGTVRSLGERSQEIGQIVTVITEIADQTNLLALNAAIEAARAGEQGRGFAVVAEEVRKLAEQSAEAAEKISLLIGEIQEETEKAVQAMEQGTVEVQQGIDVVRQAGLSFKEIGDAIESVAARAREVAAEMQEMTFAANQAASAVENIASIAQETAASSEEVAAGTEEQNANMQELATAASSLRDIAWELKKLTERFKIEKSSDGDGDLGKDNKAAPEEGGPLSLEGERQRKEEGSESSDAE